MDGCSSWETRLMLPQWSNDPWSASTTNPGLIAPSILNSIAGEGFMDSDHQTGLLSSSSIPHTMIVSPLSEPGLMGIDGSGSGSGSKSRSLDCLLSGSTTKTDPASIEDDGISLFFSDCNQKRRDHTNPGFGSFGPNKRIRKSDPGLHSGVNISFRQGSGSEPDPEAIQQMKEMIYRAAVFRPVSFGAEEAAEKPKRRNVRISSDPQTVAARQRRERISERLRALEKLVPGGSKMDTASMLDEAANYLKFLRNQVKALEASGGSSGNNNNADHLNTPCGNENYLLYPPVNLQFSPLPFTPMQGHLASTSFSIQNPSHIHLPKCSKPRLFALDHPVS